MHESAVPWQEEQGGCFACCASGRTDRVGVFGAVPWQEGGVQLLDTPARCEPSVVLGNDHNQGHRDLCVSGVTFLETTDVDGNLMVGSALPEMAAQDGEWKVWGRAGLEMVAVLPIGEQARESSICSRLGQQHVWTLLVPSLALRQMK